MESKTQKFIVTCLLTSYGLWSCNRNPINDDAKQLFKLDFVGDSFVMDDIESYSSGAQN